MRTPCFEHTFTEVAGCLRLLLSQRSCLNAVIPPLFIAMPVYLLHGFRWPRSKIRVHIILNNVDDAAPEYIFSPSTTTALLHSLSRLYPDTMKALPRLRFIEQYDPDDTSGSASSQPFAFVADKVERCELSLDVVETMNQGVDSGSWDALMDLKEHLAPEEKMGWWIVFNGDELRLQDSDSADDVGISNAAVVV